MTTSDKVIDILRAELGKDVVLTGEDVHGRSAGIWRRDTIQAKALVRARGGALSGRALKTLHQIHGFRLVSLGNPGECGRELSAERYRTGSWDVEIDGVVRLNLNYPFWVSSWFHFSLLKQCASVSSRS